MTDDDPLDLEQVADDEAAIEQLLLRSAPTDDSALQLLRDLLVDIDRDLPRATPAGHGSTVLRLAGDTRPTPRVARNGAIVAAVTAGLVAFSGVAAASTAVAPGNPLHGFGESVRAAAGAVLEAVKPPETTPAADPATATLPSPAAEQARDALAQRPSPSPAGTAGAQVAVAAQAQAAARQVQALLDEAEALLDEGRNEPAAQRLDLAERRLSAVAAGDAVALRERLEQLRSRLADEPRERTGREQPATGPQHEPGSRPSSAGRPAEAGRPADPGPREEPPAPAKPTADRSDDGDDTGDAGLRQPSRLASTKPRA